MRDPATFTQAVSEWIGFNPDFATAQTSHEPMRRNMTAVNPRRDCCHASNYTQYLSPL